MTLTLETPAERQKDTTVRTALVGSLGRDLELLAKGSSSASVGAREPAGAAELTSLLWLFGHRKPLCFSNLSL